jgi:hypothetical protein
MNIKEVKELFALVTAFFAGGKKKKKQRSSPMPSR